MIKLENVTKYYNSNGIITHALKNISLEFKKGEFVAITGPSGCGKSTLLNVICKQDTFDEGEIYYKGNETAYFNVEDMDDFRKNKIGFVFQNYNIIESYTVLQNVMLPLEIAGIPEHDVKQKALDLIEKVGLKDKVNKRGAYLSGGEKQRTVIARALANDAEILACDEPTGNLDLQTSSQIIELLHEISKDRLVLIVTHDFASVEKYATRKISLNDGMIFEDKILIPQDLKSEKEELDLDYKTVKRSVNLKVALRNLLNTPKKTIFSSLVIFCACFFVIMLYQLIVYENSISYSTNGFNYKDENKIVIGNPKYDVDISLISNITDEYVVNPIYETTALSGMVYQNNFNFNIETKPTKLKLNYGTVYQNENECVLICSDDYPLVYILTTFLESNVNFFDNQISLKITGIVISHDVDDFILCMNDSTYEDIKNLSYNYKLTIETKTFYLQPQLSNKNVIHIPLEYKDKTINDLEISIKISGLTLYKSIGDLKDIEVIYDDTKCIEISNTYDLNIKQVSVYSEIKEVTKKLEEYDGYTIINTKTYTEYSKLQQFLAKLYIYLYILLSSFVIIVIYFLSGLILNHIYKTKIYDFNVFRTLGVTKKDMSKILRYEVLIQTLIISVFTYLLTLIIGLIANEESFFVIFKYFNFGALILYFIIIVLVGILLARKINKKLFKFSVSKTFKEE